MEDDKHLMIAALLTFGWMHNREGKPEVDWTLIANSAADMEKDLSGANSRLSKTIKEAAEYIIGREHGSR